MYIFQTWGDSFTAALQNLWMSFAQFVPSFLVAIILFIVGWLVGSVIGKAIEQVIGALKVDKALASTGFEDVMNKAGLKLNVGAFIGAIVKWFVVIVFLVASLDILHLTAVTDFLSVDVLGYLPHVVVAALVLVIATLVADVMKNFVSVSAKAAHLRSANLLASVVHYAIWIFAFIIALSELGIAQAYMQIVFTGLVAMLAIAGGLAFGLGGKEAASRAIEKLHEHTKPM